MLHGGMCCGCAFMGHESPNRVDLLCAYNCNMCTSGLAAVHYMQLGCSSCWQHSATPFDCSSCWRPSLFLHIMCLINDKLISVCFCKPVCFLHQQVLKRRLARAGGDASDAVALQQLLATFSDPMRPSSMCCWD
jgi:hypothetical protein